MRRCACWPTTGNGYQAGPGRTIFTRSRTCAARGAGSASMGRFRYVVLIAGKGPERATCCCGSRSPGRRPNDLYRTGDNRTSARLVARAERVWTVQRLSQAANNQPLGLAVDRRPVRFRSSRSARRTPASTEGAQGRRPRWGGPGAGRHPGPGACALGHARSGAYQPARRVGGRRRLLSAGAGLRSGLCGCGAQRDYTRFVGARAELTVSALGWRGRAGRVGREMRAIQSPAPMSVVVHSRMRRASSSS